ncbi:MAG: archaeal flagellar protein FlaJ [Thermoplasmata archaeon]|jgi:flagellar protein FlaJ|nr:archaeal flagellar protein FlaJ [Thermoplasmata archaeon]
MTGLGALDRFAYIWLGERARGSASLGKLEESLRKAQMPVRSEAYLAKCMLVAIATAFVSLLLAVLGLFAAMTVLDLPAASWVLVLFVPPMAGYIAYVATTATPASNAKKRAKNIDQRIAYGTNYIAAMASAGVIPAEIFKSLAKQAIYGEVSKEAAMIYKDLEVHGKDIVTSLRRAIDRTPSIKFQELLQGGITTITSGGDLTGYFRQKAARYQWENRVEQKTFIDTMGLMAETYVTSAVAGPLFLIVMVAIIVLMGSGTMSQLQLVIFLLLPVINLGFMFGLKAMIPEV